MESTKERATALCIFAKMFRNVLILSLLGITVGTRGFEPCGIPAGCYCSTPVLNQIQCLDNITVFPLFYDLLKAEIRSIVFHRSKIAGLPQFNKKEWTGLQHLSFIETDLMSCEAIAELKRPGLRIFSECISKKQEEDCPSCNKGIAISLIFVLILLMLFIGAVGYIIYLSQSRSGSWTFPVPQVSTPETSLNMSMPSCAKNRSDVMTETEVRCLNTTV